MRIVGTLRYCGQRSTGHVTTEVGVCTSVVLGIFDRITFPWINWKRLGNRLGKLIINCKVKACEVK